MISIDYPQDAGTGLQRALAEAEAKLGTERERAQKAEDKLAPATEALISACDVLRDIRTGPLLDHKQVRWQRVATMIDGILARAEVVIGPRQNPSTPASATPEMESRL